jgi:hypothetical protein
MVLRAAQYSKQPNGLHSEGVAEAGFNSAAVIGGTPLASLARLRKNPQLSSSFVCTPGVLQRRILTRPAELPVLRFAVLFLSVVASIHLGATGASAQRFTFQHYEQDEGLKNHDVFKLMQDKTGLECHRKPVGDMTFQVRDWLISALAEISEEQLHSYSGTGEMFLWYSFLNIGPLRTALSGGFACGSLSEAFAVIKEHVRFRLSSSPEGGCFPDFLFPLDQSALRSIANCHRGSLN